MAKLHRQLSDQSKAYKIVENLFDKMIAPAFLEDAVVQGLVFEQAYGNYVIWNNHDFLFICRYQISEDLGKRFKDESVKRYVRHIVAKRRKEYEVLISKPFLWRLWYFITRTVRGKQL